MTKPPEAAGAAFPSLLSDPLFLFRIQTRLIRKKITVEIVELQSCELVWEERRVDNAIREITQPLVLWSNN